MVKEKRVGGGSRISLFLKSIFSREKGASAAKLNDKKLSKESRKLVPVSTSGTVIDFGIEESVPYHFLMEELLEIVLRREKLR